MYVRLNEVFVRFPELYLGLMAAIAVAPWIVIAFIKPAVLFPFALCPLALCAFYAFAPFATKKEDAFQQRVERSYRLIRLIVLPLLVVATAAISRAYPDLDLGPFFGALMVSMAAAMFTGQHIRFRWLKPVIQTAEAQTGSDA